MFLINRRLQPKGRWPIHKKLPTHIEAMDQWLGMLRTALEKNYNRLDGVLAAIDTKEKGEMR
jgi:hypothetical protein